MLLYFSFLVAVLLTCATHVKSLSYTDVDTGSFTGCVDNCVSLPNGNYQSCKGCTMYVTCVSGYIIDNRPCPDTLLWDDKHKKCLYASSTCSNDNVSDTIYIIAESNTAVFKVNSGRSVEPLQGYAHDTNVGCYKCAYYKHNNQLYLSGSGNRPESHTSLFTPPQNYTQENDLPKGGDSAPFSFIIKSRLYVAGGWYNAALKTVYSRSLASGSAWQAEVDLPGIMDYTARSGVVHNDNVYITGGRYQWGTSNAVFKWSPGESKWQEIAPMKYWHRYHCNVLVKNKFIFVIGGRSNKMNSVEVYDIDNAEWSLRSPSPYAVKHYPSCAVAGEVIYVYFEDSLYSYDTATDSWEKLYTMESKAWGTAMIVV